VINRQKDVQKCRAGPRLEMSRCIRTDRCERRTGMDMYSNSFVRCRGGVFVATAERGIGGKPVAFSGNVVSDWSAVNTAPLAVRSLQSCRQNRVYRDWYRPLQQLLLRRDRHGRTVMSATLNIAACEFAKDRWSRSPLGWGLLSVFWRSDRGNAVERQVC